MVGKTGVREFFDILGARRGWSTSKREDGPGPCRRRPWLDKDSAGGTGEGGMVARGDTSTSAHLTRPSSGPLCLSSPAGYLTPLFVILLIEHTS